MQRRRATKGLLLAIVAGFLMAMVIPALAPAAAAAPVTPATGSATQQWAYGAEKWVNITEIGPNSTYTVHAFFGWSVIFTATNTSTTVVALEAQRTVAAYAYVDYCSPNCATPVLHANLSANGWEKDFGFANFTIAATVYEGGAPASALGILNASASSAGQLDESMTLTMSKAPATHTYSGSLKVKGTSQASISFSPALGLVPWNVAPGSSWNSSSMFSAMGSWQASWTAMRTTPSGTISGTGNPSGSVSGSGTLTLNGTDLGTIHLGDGKTVPVIVLEISGPFDCVDGIILIPHDFDLFGGGSHAWDANSYGVTQLLTSKVDLFVDAIHHRVIFEAAASTASTSSPGLPVTGYGAPGPVQPVTPPPAQPVALTPAGAEIQAQPETVAQAQQQATCLAGECAPASTGTAAMLTAILIGLAVVAVVTAAVLIGYRASSRRRAGEGSLPKYGPGLSDSATPPIGAVAPPPPPPHEPPKTF